MDELYSVRMRAAQGGPHENGGHHISGAERMVTLNQVGFIKRFRSWQFLMTSIPFC